MDEELLPKDKIELLLKEAQELTAIFIASRKTASNNQLKIENNQFPILHS